MSTHDAGFTRVACSLVAMMVLIACASQRHAGTASLAPPGDQNVAILNILRGDDRQAEILTFDGVSFAAFAGSNAKPGHFRVRLHAGVHELRVVLPGPCTYYDGRPAPGSSLSNLRFTARAGAEYEVTLASFPSQLFTQTEVHVYEVIEAPNKLRSVEEVISIEPDSSSCPDRQ